MDKKNHCITLLIVDRHNILINTLPNPEATEMLKNLNQYQVGQFKCICLYWEQDDDNNYKVYDYNLADNSKKLVWTNIPDYMYNNTLQTYIYDPYTAILARSDNFEL